MPITRFASSLTHTNSVFQGFFFSEMKSMTDTNHSTSSDNKHNDGIFTSVTKVCKIISIMHNFFKY